MKKTFFVSVIIPTKNSGATLEACLESIKKQKYKNIELIIVDNYSTDNTLVIANRYTDLVFSTGPERSAQRNFGAQKSSGEFLLFIDSDMRLSPDVVTSCMNKIKSNEMFKGIIIPEESFGVSIWAECKKLERSFYVGVDWIEATRFLCKNAFIEVGSYDEKMNSGEDWDLSQRIKDKYEIGRISDFIFHNEGDLSLYNIVRKKFLYGKEFSHYTKKQKYNSVVFKKQTGMISRYGLFFNSPNKLFKNPLLGLCMLFMKTCEFGFGGIGYLLNKKLIVEISKPKSISDKDLPIISFILPTFNAAKFLIKTLDSIFMQDYPREKIEVLLVDGGSSDSTLSIAQKYPLKIINNKRRIAEFAKTIGINESKGEYFVLIDSDNEIVKNDWLRNMVRPILEHPSLFGVESPLSYDKSLSSLNKYFARMRIADPLAKYLASKPERIKRCNGYDILEFSKNAILITGANGFLWNKNLVQKHSYIWNDKFEEANFSTYIHEKTGANYATPYDTSIRHFYCNSLSDFVVKRIKIAGKTYDRLNKNEYTWVKNVNNIKIFLYVIYLGTIIGPTAEALYKNIKYRTNVYVWHPVVSLGTVAVYLVKLPLIFKKRI